MMDKNVERSRRAARQQAARYRCGYATACELSLPGATAAEERDRRRKRRRKRRRRDKRDPYDETSTDDGKE